MSRPKALGKGLGALLPSDATGEGGGNPYFLCSIEQIVPNPYQPRKSFKSEALDQLAESIREKGVLQPLVVRKRENGPGYELIAGERRLQAARLAGLKEVPVLLKKVGRVDRLELAIIENIQRQSLNPLEEAGAYARLMEEFGHTQEEVARQVGKKRSTVANSLRLLHLPDFAQDDVVSGRLTMGHARALLSVHDSEAIKRLRDEIVGRGLSVRQAEVLAQKLKDGPATKRPVSPKKSPAIPRSYSRVLEKKIVGHLDSKCRIVQNGERGKLEIEYYSPDDLDRLISLITAERQIA